MERKMDRKKPPKSHNVLSRLMSLCWSAFLSSCMQLPVHMAAAWVPLCPGGQRAGKAKWKSGENRIFHSIKKKTPPGAQNTWIQPDIKADVHRMILEAETKWQVKAKESHPPVCIPINSALNIAFSHQVSE